MSTRLVYGAFVAAVLLGSCSSTPEIRQSQCSPCIVSPRVGPLLNEAKQMINDKNFEGATAKLNEAEAVKSSADDEKVISQMRRAVQIVQAGQPRQSQP
jgi:hypothetical protein